MKAASYGLLVLLCLTLPSLPASAQSPGAVYAMTNALEGNSVLVYDRAADGTLIFRASYPTDGLGIGATTEPVDALGSQNPLLLSPNGRWLFAVNAGSDEISVFEARNGGLVLVDKVSSGGPFPASLTLHRDLLYVLNAGNDGNITGFTLDGMGHLTPVPGSTRTLGAGGTNPPFFLVSPAQVGFSPAGDALLVTIKGTDRILVFAVDETGAPSAAPVTTISHGSTPFGFAFDRRSHLLVAEPFGNGEVGQPLASAVSSYDLAADGGLEVLSGSVDNFQTASCWLVVAGRYAYVTNNASDTISGYRIGCDGTLELIDADGVSAETGEHPVDAAVSRDRRFLYNVNAGSGTISMFRIAADGSLSSLGEIGGLPADAGAVGIAAR